MRRTFVSAIVVVTIGATITGCRPGLLGDTGDQPQPSRPLPPGQAQLPPAPVDPTKIVPDLVVVNSTLGYQQLEAAGTGIVLTSSGEVLTNDHVITGATSIKVTDAGDGQTYTASMVGYDRAADVAVLQLDGAHDLGVAPIGTGTPQPGAGVFAVGNAGGTGLSVAPGRVIALNQSITASDESAGSSEQLNGLIQVSANVRPGDSGGPLVDVAGTVVGIDTAATTGFRFVRSNSHAGYAIPIATAMPIAARIEAGRASATVHIGPSAMLGVTVSTPPAAQNGALVADFLSDSPLGDAGLAAGDLITSLDGAPVDSPYTLTTLMDLHQPGQSVTVGWVDSAGAPHTTAITLVTGPAG